MRLIIHDLRKEQADQFLPQDIDTHIIYQRGEIKHCTGCLDCWTKTPGECVLKDSYSNMGELLSKTDELVIVSRCVYGSYSPFVKNILDRSISYLLPEFEVEDGEMRHQLRYKNDLHIRVLFYGEDTTEWEKETARNLVQANAEHLHAVVDEIQFDMQDLGGLPC